ncbi:EamA/RhaT family transporter [Pleomorphomonas diazotrophica]|uniref:EamA/RhaT family transporter n=1 Tax=Pleomorphomonas diazotrophica TaxID=1166257 RepID=A0A1I4VS81_9HYPH|nr:DMT family transporter [Pleomorphomonas diazotrophica]PKR89367.1 EamA/RhaT family transporter [Pleomorphomonas diazotrophica]SFN04072.1 EamA-like transporter family protein [Pleomorphomonas diazotrophica]
MPSARSLPLSARPGEVVAFLALCLGAVAMGISPIFVRIADVGPFASAFWRVALAVPVLALWAMSEGGAKALLSAFRSRAIWLAGFFFAIDLFFWHLSILNTSIANATFLSSMAPIWVLLFSGLFIGEKVGRREAGGVIVCILGGAVLLGGSYTLDADKLIGDIYGIGTSFGFGTYFLAVRAARREHRTGTVTFGATTVTALCLGMVALAFEPKLLPSSLAGAATLAALAYVSHIGGQGLLAFALGYLSAAFSSLVIFMEVIAAAALAFLVFGEAIGWSQGLGGLMILGGIWIARPRS